ncbi:hypothetical protein AAD018_012875 [Aestuariibius insulae]|uniref:hypothetical protein n=1 Tax=Aestuariibius insulae TaxID=2058287 RepID=UPI00345E8094
MRHAIAALAFAIALPAAAETPLSAEEFGAFTEGKTLNFYRDGVLFGAEQYRSNKRVRWSFIAGQEQQDCMEGVWYEQEGDICFSYEDGLVDQCWAFFRDGDGLRATFRNTVPNVTGYTAQETTEPLLCLGPNVGV